eukprot:3718000-Alexandrium_andersonii.AAC.1
MAWARARDIEAGVQRRPMPPRPELSDVESEAEEGAEPRSEDTDGAAPEAAPALDGRPARSE